MTPSHLKRVTKIWGGPQKVTRCCEHCGETFDSWRRRLGVERRFCSRTCYYAAVAPRPAFLVVECPQCGTSFRRTRGAISRVKASTCSRRCSQILNSGSGNHMYRGGEKHRRGPGWVANRRIVRERDKVCRLCGKTPETNGQALSVDHLIPWRIWADEEAANQPSNLVALCRSCHAKKTARLERAYWKGDVLDFERFLEQLGIDASHRPELRRYLAEVTV